MLFPSFNRRGGFTLMELLMVVGIVGLLIAILLPAANKALTAAKRARIASDLNAISFALQQYHDDFKDYPRLTEAELSGMPDANRRKYGSDLLVRALIAPFSKNPVNTTAANFQNTSDPEDNFDGADGPGFRIRRILVGASNPSPGDTAQGEVKGPYIAADKFRFAFDTSVNPPALQLLDRYDNAVLYYPAGLAKVNINTVPLYADGTTSNRAMYDTRYGDNKFAPSPKALRNLLGDLDNNGAIGAGEEAATVGPFILWSAGPDGRFGLQEPTETDAAVLRAKIQKLDDVTNFK